MASSPVRIEREGRVAVVVIDNPPVNAGSTAVRAGLLEAVREVTRDAALDAAVLIGAGTTFVAGSDIREFGLPLEEPQLPAVLAEIAASPKPFVAAIHGAALGGGFELALACDARLAAPGAVVGLPEVTLGMIPGAGGTQHVPRLVGIARAIELVCAGTRVPATEAARIGLVDALVEADLRGGAVAHAASPALRKRPLGREPVPADAQGAIEAAERKALHAGNSRPQVAAAIAAIKDAAAMPYPQALARERAVFQQLREGPEAAALRHLFFAERDAAKVPGVDPDAARPIAQAGIVGAGTMGVGIAICFANAGIAVKLIDQDPASVARGLDRVRERYGACVAAGRLEAQEAERRIDRMAVGTELAALERADLVVEAVFEDLALKEALFRRLGAIARPDAILATNTSCLDVNRMAAASGRPRDVLGLHFFNPAEVMRLLEIVRADETSTQALATAMRLARKLRKLAIVAKSSEGFIGNRLYAAYRRQCESMLEEGAYPQEVDAALEAFGFARGPFAVADASGLDIARRMRRGQDASRERGISRRKFEPAEIQWRALAALLNEAGLLLAEGVAQRPSDVDLALVAGYGFPRHEGGILFWASRQDPARLRAAIDELERASGLGFRRAPAYRRDLP